MENFRENIKQGFLPLPTDVTFEGIVKDYYFDTRCSATVGTPVAGNMHLWVASCRGQPDGMAVAPSI